jgi:hypothetical protein
MDAACPPQFRQIKYLAQRLTGDGVPLHAKSPAESPVVVDNASQVVQQQDYFAAVIPDEIHEFHLPGDSQALCPEYPAGPYPEDLHGYDGRCGGQNGEYDFP